MKLHLGCGDRYKKGWVNVDFVGDIADQLVNLTEYPWPWDTGSVDEIWIEHVIEHFDRPEFLMKEMHRVLKPGGTVMVITPHRNSVSACAIDHKSFMSYVFFDQFVGDNPMHYWPAQNDNCCFEQVVYKVLIFKQPWLSWTPFDWVASRFPYFWEKFAFGMLQPTEIHWCGKKPS